MIFKTIRLTIGFIVVIILQQNTTQLRNHRQVFMIGIVVVFDIIDFDAFTAAARQRPCGTCTNAVRQAVTSNRGTEIGLLGTEILRDRRVIRQFWNGSQIGNFDTSQRVEKVRQVRPLIVFQLDNQKIQQIRALQAGDVLIVLPKALQKTRCLLKQAANP